MLQLQTVRSLPVPRHTLFRRSSRLLTVVSLLAGWCLSLLFGPAAGTAFAEIPPFFQLPLSAFTGADVVTAADAITLAAVETATVVGTGTVTAVAGAGTGALAAGTAVAVVGFGIG